MADQPVQSIENHVKMPTTIMAIGGVYLLTMILGFVGLATGKIYLVALAVVLAAVGGVLTALVSRLYSTGLQDRIVRLEMRLRLREVLPDDLAADIADFQLGQLIALRFASDDELPELARKVLDEKITSQTEIKKLIKDWQADWHRV